MPSRLVILSCVLVLCVACDSGETEGDPDGGDVADAGGGGDRDGGGGDPDGGGDVDGGGGMCGDGTTQPTETCDGDCPASCDDADACTTDTRTGTPERCDVACGHTDITACADGDGCCPIGCAAADDGDCAGADQCTIDGVVYDADDLDPAGDCRICDPPSSRTDWTPCPAPVWRRAWPTARGGHAMVAIDGGVLLYGGDPEVSGRGADEVYRWDGRRWHDETHLAQPVLGVRVGMGMAYDSIRDRVVVFGGYTPPSGRPVEEATFERAPDGTWSASALAGPEARTFAAMAYDPLREVVILFGGRSGPGTNLRDTWQYDGSAWTEVTPSGSPLPRHGAAMAFDPTRGALVLHGGTDGTTTYDDTWEWDGGAWTRGDAGPRRALHAMTYDAREGALLVYGGTSGRGDTAVASLHARDASGAWSDVSTTSGPGRRNQVAMAYDPTTRATYLFGGYSPDDTIRSQNQLFAWDASGFRMVGAAPTPRLGHAMAYDSARERTVLFGGRQHYSGAPPGPLQETWEFDGARWELVAEGGPDGRTDHAMAYDPRRGVTVLYGGAGDERTWEWDGSTWTPITTSATPGVVIRHAMAYDPDYEGVLLMGGRRGAALSAETWLFDGSAWANLGRTSIRGREEHSMTYDEGGARVLSCGGDTDGSGRGLYAWMDSDWTRLSAADGFCVYGDNLIAHDRRRDLSAVFLASGGMSTYLSGGIWTALDSPRARERSAMAGGPRGVVLFGGYAGFGVSSYGFEDTWVLAY